MKRLLLAPLVAALVACSGAADAGAPTIELGLREFGIAPSAAAYLPGEVELVATNDGEFGHTVVVTSASGEVVAASDLIAPGETVTMSVDLRSGAYEISCRIVTEAGDGRLFDHYERGMVTEISEGT